MQIGHNITALNTYNRLNSAEHAQAKSMAKLSSGLRINSASDDAAGLAISEKMRGQIRGLDQANRNAQDATSLVQTAEGALNETHSILQRQRELAVQASNDSNTDTDRKAIQDEMDQLGKETDRIANTTQFNNKTLLDGSMDKTTSAQANIQNNNAMGASGVVATALTALTDKDGNSLGIQAGDTVKVSYVMNGSTVETSTTAGVKTLGDLDDGNFTLGDGANGLEATATANGATGAIHGLTITVTDANGNVRTGASNALSSFTETQQATDVHADSSLNFQIGANTGQTLNLAISKMDSSALGTKDLKVGNAGQANVAIKVIDEAISKVSSQRSVLGATANRLEHTINNLSTSSENMQSAESRIRDVDMAKEVMENTKQSILAQASQAMLGQANQAPQQVLQLLRG